MMAEAVAKTGGVVRSLAFNRTGDPDTVVFDDAVVFKTFGQIPSDLAMLIKPALPSPSESRFSRRGIEEKRWGRPSASAWRSSHS